MTVSQLQKKIGLKALNGIHDKEIAGAYVSDMLSDVMAGAKPGNIWVTIQIHKNIVAVANLVDVSASESGLSAEEVYDLYRQKPDVNHQRQDGDYSMKSKDESDNQQITL